MAVRSAWKGYIKLSLVTCAVELFNATTATEKVSFRILNRATGNTVTRQYVDSGTGKVVGDDDEIKGYETSSGHYLLIEEDEIEAVQIESNHTLNLEGFVEKSEIDPIYLDTPYYLAPADEVSEEAFAVIRDALAAKKMAGMARMVLYRRERPVVIEARDRGMLLTTLRFDKLVRKPETIFGAYRQGQDRQRDDRACLAHHRPQEIQIRSLGVRRQIRGRAARADQGQEGGQEGAGLGASAEAVERGQSVRRLEEEPEFRRRRQGVGRKGQRQGAQDQGAAPGNRLRARRLPPPRRSIANRRRPWPASSNTRPSAISAPPASRAARRRAGKAKSPGGIFVVQKHDATRLHYDFRLEHDGVLWSWAVTRGPSLDPQDKRLAVHVEDHPLDYASFEGVIPEGNYGAGSVIVWDEGSWIPHGDPAAMMKKGHINFELKGDKLRGAWHLVRLRPRSGEKRDNWLLIKSDDEYADRKRDILEDAPQSVKSGLTVEEVGKDPDARHWQSNRKAKKGAADREDEARAGKGEEPRARPVPAKRSCRPSSRLAWRGWKRTRRQAMAGCMR